MYCKSIECKTVHAYSTENYIFKFSLVPSKIDLIGDQQGLSVLADV